MQQLRAGKRVNSEGSGGLEWEEDGAHHTAQGWTVDISPKGCLAIVPQGFALGQKLGLVNLVNKNVAKAILIWRGHEGRYRLGIGPGARGTSGRFLGIGFLTVHSNHLDRRCGVFH